MLDRSVVGHTTTPALVDVERGAIRRFAESLGDSNPLYFEHDVARSHGFHSVIAPPTFVASLCSGVDLRERLGVPVRTLLCAEVSIESERPVCAGERLFVASRIVDVGERTVSTGKVQHAVIEEEGRDESGALVFRTRKTYVTRSSKES